MPQEERPAHGLMVSTISRPSKLMRVLRYLWGKRADQGGKGKREASFLSS